MGTPNDMKLGISGSQVESIILGVMMALYAYWSWKIDRIYFINSIVDKDKNPQGFYAILGLFAVVVILCIAGAFGLIPGQPYQGHVR